MSNQENTSSPSMTSSAPSSSSNTPESPNASGQQPNKKPGAFIQHVRRNLMDVIRFIIYNTFVEISILVVVFIIIFLLSRNTNYIASIITIQDQVASSFFAALSSALSALLGLLIAFQIFLMQVISDKRGYLYGEFKSEQRQLITLVSTRPNSLSRTDKATADLISTITSIRRRDLPLEPGRGKIVKQAIKELEDQCSLQDTSLNREESAYCHQIILILSSINEITFDFSVLSITTSSLNSILSTILKLSFITIISIALVLAFSTSIKLIFFPDINIAVTYTALIGLIIIFIELIIKTKYLYQNIKRFI